MIPTLPDFTRFQWASVVEKEWFAPLISSASNAFLQLERLSVVEGVRKAAWQFASYDELIPLCEWARRHDLVVIPVHNASLSGSYSSSGGGTGNYNAYRIVITRPEHYKEVMPFEGDAHIGNMLGFPKCCQESFLNTWAKSSVDTTWEQMTTDVSPYASTLLRWMGIRFVPHLPCKYDCAESIAFGQAMEQVGRKHGYVEEMLFIKEALNWPVLGTRLFGVAELTSPGLKIVTRTNWTPTKEDFFKKGQYSKPVKELWTENGFASADAMRTAHAILTMSIKDEIPVNARVMDLGCGNGLLLRKLKLHRPDIKLFGVEMTDAINRARAPLTGGWMKSTIQESNWIVANPTTVLINPVRLLEMTPEDAEKQRFELATVPVTIVYCYSDYESLEKLCADAKLPAPRMLTKTPSVSIGVI